MSIPDILLAVCVLILVWRVWRLEDGKREVYDTMRQMLKINDIGRAGEIDVLRAENRLHEVINKDRARMHALARALGYEWKRTDAKDGWERAMKPDDPKNSVPAGVVYGSPYFGCPPIRYFEAMDRRKADRRKPVVREAAVAAAAEVTRLTNKARSKKPRRAH